MQGFRTVIYRRIGSIARITLNRPEVLNAYNVQMRDDLWEVLSAIRVDTDIKVVIVDGAGRAFCAGADLSEFLTAPSPVIARDVRRQRDLWRLMLALPQPMVAALHGYVIGSGLEIALSCDLRLCAEGTRFRLPETGYGFIPGAGGTQLLPRATSRSFSLRHILTGEWFDASTAKATGLVLRVIKPSLLEDEFLHLAQLLASQPERALQTCKEAVKRGSNLPTGEALLLEKRLAAGLE
jgi:enoyl-CoA hydratase/carnithine racemase